MRARAGASGSPSGGGIRSTIASSTLIDVDPGLRGDANDALGIAAEELRHLEGGTVRIGRGKIDLVHDGHDLELVLDREVRVRKRLRLDPLRRVDDEHGPLAGLERARDLVGEVDMPRRIDQVQLMTLPRNPHRLRLDRDAALALEVHRVEQLRAHVTVGDRIRELQDAVGQRRLPMVDVGDDREVADPALVHGNQARMLAVMRVSAGPALRCSARGSVLRVPRLRRPVEFAPRPVGFPSRRDQIRDPGSCFRHGALVGGVPRTCHRATRSAARRVEQTLGTRNNAPARTAYRSSTHECP